MIMIPAEARAATKLLASIQSGKYAYSCPLLIQTRSIRLRSWWKKEFLKDLYHRRLLAGPEPIVPRSAHPNWHYPAEIAALSHRIGAPQLDSYKLQRALTDRSFFEQNDKGNFVSDIIDQPLKKEFDETISLTKNESNEELISDGLETVTELVRGFLRLHWPRAPEEFVEAVAERLYSLDAIVNAAKILAIPDLVRCGEYLPMVHSIRDAFLALVSVLPGRAKYDFVLRTLLPPLNEIALEDVMSFRNPLPILTAYLKKWKNVRDVEPRLLQSGASQTSIPFYVVGVYADQHLIGQSPGETLWNATDMAAQISLLNLWGVSASDYVFPFRRASQFTEQHFIQAKKPNHGIKEIVADSSIDLSEYNEEELAADPIDIVEIAQKYAYQVKPLVGYPHRRRMRHFFSRGTLNRWSYRFIVQPKVSTI